MTSLTTPHPKAMVRSLVRSTQGLHSSYMVFFQLPWLPEMGITGPGRALFRRTLRRSGLSEAALDEYLRVLSQPGAATGAFNWYRALPFLPPSRVERTNVPVLYVYGTADFALGRKAADMTRDYVDGPFRYEILEGVSHWIPEAVPDVVGRLLLEHFASVHGRPGPRTGV
jgi:pimeloyl-ACP methyl ester carboxylesterase